MKYIHRLRIANHYNTYYTSDELRLSLGRTAKLSQFLCNKINRKRAKYELYDSLKSRFENAALRHSVWSDKVYN